MKTLKITIWDLEARRIASIERKLYEAMKEYGIRGVVVSQSEPPLVSRMNLTGRIPVLEVGGLFWSQQPGKEFDKAACAEFIKIIMEKDPIPYMKKRKS